MKEWKKIIFYAIIPAIIAGIFAVAPKLYDEFTEPKARLIYDITRGPLLKEGSDFKSIFAIQVNNAGKRPLSSIFASIRTKSKIAALNTFDETGLSPLVDLEFSPPNISVKTLHQNESFTISLMLISPNEDMGIEIVLRSNEVLGEKFEQPSDKKGISSDLLSAITTSLAVFFMVITVMIRFRKGGSMPGMSYKQDTLFYIAAKLNLTNLVNSYGIKEGSLTYMRFGDMLLSQGYLENQKSKAILALKAMLLIEHISENSQKLIIRNIELLENENFSEEEIEILRSKAANMSPQYEFRNLIDLFIEDPVSFAASPNKANQKDAQ